MHYLQIRVEVTAQCFVFSYTQVHLPLAARPVCASSDNERETDRERERERERERVRPSIDPVKTVLVMSFFKITADIRGFQT